MREKRKKKLWKIKGRLKLFEFFLISIIVLNLFLSYIFWNMSNKTGSCLLEQRTLVILALGFALIEVIFLVIILVLLHRAIEPFQRIEKVLEKTLSGDYSTRLTLRKKDIAYSFVGKLNKIIDLLEKKTGQDSKLQTG